MMPDWRQLSFGLEEKKNLVLTDWKLRKIVYLDAINRLTRLGYSTDQAVGIMDRVDAHDQTLQRV
jgi:hypothetical protein